MFYILEISMALCKFKWDFCSWTCCFSTMVVTEGGEGEILHRVFSFLKCVYTKWKSITLFILYYEIDKYIYTWYRWTSQRSTHCIYSIVIILWHAYLVSFNSHQERKNLTSLFRERKINVFYVCSDWMLRVLFFLHFLVI